MEKILDGQGRWRNTTVAFRMSKEENEDLNTRVKLSGLTKQEYLINRSLCRDIVVVGNPRVFKALRNEMASILDELRRIESGRGVDDQLLKNIELITVTLRGLNE